MAIQYRIKCYKKYREQVERFDWSVARVDAEEPRELRGHGLPLKVIHPKQ